MDIVGRAQLETALAALGELLAARRLHYEVVSSVAANSLADRITAEGMPEPNPRATGDDFTDAFDRWVVDMTDWLRLPSRT